MAWSPTAWPQLSLMFLKWSMSAITHTSGVPSRLARRTRPSPRSNNARRFRQPLSTSWLASCASSRFFNSSSCLEVARSASTSNNWRCEVSSAVTSPTLTRQPRSPPCSSVNGEQLNTTWARGSLVASAPFSKPSSARVAALLSAALGSTLRAALSSASARTTKAKPRKLRRCVIASIQGAAAPPASAACSQGRPCARRPINAWVSPGGRSASKALLTSRMRPWVSTTITPSASVSNALRTRSGTAAEGSRCSSMRRRYR